MQKSRAQDVLEIESIIKLIAAAKEAGVRRFQYGHLHFSFIHSDHDLPASRSVAPRPLAISDLIRPGIPIDQSDNLKEPTEEQMLFLSSGYDPAAERAAEQAKAELYEKALSENPSRKGPTHEKRSA